MKLHLLLTVLVTTAVVITAQDRDTSTPDSANAEATRADAATAGGAPPNAAASSPASPANDDKAGEQKTSVTEGSRLTDEDTARAAEHRRASEIIGMDIMNKQNEKIGSVDDLAVDLSSGRVAAVIISSGGFLGIADELSIVPSSALTLTEDNKAFSANLTKDQLTNAPHFQGSEYPDLNDQKYMLNVYSAYQAEPYLESTNSDTTVDGARRVLRASEILGMDVNNHQDETIGDINELILNRALNRVTSAVVSSGGFLEIGSALSVVPAGSVTTTEDAVLIDATKESLERSPRFAENEWPERMNEPNYLVDVYEPYQFSTHYEDDDTDAVAKVDSTRTDANTKAGSETEVDRDQDKDPKKLTAQDQSNAPGDLDATATIRRKIVSHDDLSFRAKNIRVITVDGKVTLAGEVASEREMETILKVARDEMGGAEITNNLSLKD